MEQVDKIKVLQIAGGFRKNVNGKPVSGGVPSFLFNYHSKMNKEKIHFDFLAIRNQAFAPYIPALEKSGAKVTALDIQSDGFKRFLATIKQLTAFLKEHEYDAVHINMGSFFPVLTCAIAAKRAGVKNVIAHSHSSGIYSKKKRMVANLLSPILSLFADQYCACSMVAAENLFSNRIIKNNQFKIIRNAIDVDKFAYDEEERNALRAELDLSDKLVIGHVGRFVDVKNHEFLIDFFKEFSQWHREARLLLLGDGDLKQSIEKKVENLGLRDKVLFMGQKTDAFRYYQAMDVFILPSLLEGFPIVAMEAQSTGLPTYVSTTITDEADVTDLSRFFDLKDGPQALAKTVSDDLKNADQRQDASQQIIDAGYSLEDNLREFESLYWKTT